MATRLPGARLNLLTAHEVDNARDRELSDGGGLLLRCSGTNAAWVFRYTSATGKRREMGLDACVRHNARAAGESLAQAGNEPVHEPPRRPETHPAVRLLLSMENGSAPILEIPKVSYDGVGVLELFEKHRMAGSTKVTRVEEMDSEPTG
jgi:hypothetical protein